MAVEAFDEMKERHDSITTQRDDILKAKDDYLKSIEPTGWKRVMLATAVRNERLETS